MSFEQAREYLARVIPWPQEGEETSYCNIHWVTPNRHDPKKKPFFNGKPFTSLDAAINHLEYLTKQGNVLDIYVCMSSQRTHETKRNASTGKEFTIAVRGQETAVKLKSLFIDLDAKGEDKNSYANVIEASKALAKFTQDTGLPKPSLVVLSGYGLHVYWTLMSALDPAAWTPLAYALAEATKQHGLKCDTQCTIDSARVLRVPGTKNYKRDVPAEVRLTKFKTDFEYSNDKIERALEPYKVAVPKLRTAEARDFSSFPVRPPLTAPSELGLGVDTSKYDPLDLDLILPECPWLNDVVTTGGKDVSNPLWSITTLIATFCSDGRTQAHRMGNQHPGYEPESTDELFDRKVSEQKAKNLGWPACQTISTQGAKQCQTCPHLAASKSPLRFGISSRQLPASPCTIYYIPQTSTQAATSTASQPPSDLPNGYTRRHDGIILENITLPDNTVKQTEVSSYVMDDPWLQKDPNILHFTTVTDKGNNKQITIETRDVGGMTMRAILQEQGFMIPPGKGSDIIARFIVAWVQRLQQTRQSVKSNPFGWDVDNGVIKGFAYGGSLWGASGPSPSANPDSTLQRIYKPCGAMAPWIAASKMVTDQKRQDVAAIVAAAFAAPLVKFTGQDGMLLSAYSMESGKGKSTSMKIAQAVWGCPQEAMQALDDTPNATVGKLVRIKHLPIFWDELKTRDQYKGFTTLAFQMTLGKGKARMAANASLKSPGTWQTLLISASNDSLLDFVVKNTITTTAGLYRVFELVVVPAADGSPGQLSSTDAALITAKLTDNFGQVGLEYAKYLGSNHASIAADVQNCLNSLEKETKAIQDERFWLALIACILVGAGYANQLGFTEFDLPELKAFLLGVLTKMRVNLAKQPVDLSQDVNLNDVLVQYFDAMAARHTVQTDRMHNGKGKPAHGSVVLLNSLDRLESLQVQFAKNDKLVRFTTTSFYDWYREKYDKGATVVVQQLEAKFGMRELQSVRIGAGVEHNAITKFTQRCFELNLGANNILGGCFV